MQRGAPRLGVKTTLLGLLVLLVAVIIFTLYNSILKKPTLVTRNLVRSTAVFKEHKAPLWAVQFQPTGITTLCYSPDGARLATGSYNAVVRVWNTANRRC